MVFINETGILGTILLEGTKTTTGNMFVSLMVILIILIAFGLLFNIKLEYMSILFLPTVLAYASYYQEFLGTLGALIFYISLVLSKNWIFK